MNCLCNWSTFSAQLHAPAHLNQLIAWNNPVLCSVNLSQSQSIMASSTWCDNCTGPEEVPGGPGSHGEGIWHLGVGCECDILLQRKVQVRPRERVRCAVLDGGCARQSLLYCGALLGGWGASLTGCAVRALCRCFHVCMCVLQSPQLPCSPRTNAALTLWPFP